MVIGPNGEKMGIKKLSDALTLAGYAGLDLVLMNQGNGVAVTKIMDYNKFRYEKHSGKCVLEAYLRGQTIGKFIGDYGMDSSIDEEGYEQYSAWYNGKFHYTNGKQKDFSFWVD